jgi:hypothetical protein
MHNEAHMKHFIFLFFFLPVLAFGQVGGNPEHVIIDTLASESSLVSREFSGYYMLLEE